MLTFETVTQIHLNAPLSLKCIPIFKVSILNVEELPKRPDSVMLMSAY